MVLDLGRIGRTIVVVALTLFCFAPLASSVAMAQEAEGTPTDGGAPAAQESAPAPDTTPPVFAPYANLAVEAVEDWGAQVFYTMAASDAVNGSVGVSCDVTSGWVFPIGTTTVTCVAQDAAANQAVAAFTVTVNPLPDAKPQTQESAPTEGQSAGPSSAPAAPTGSTSTPEQKSATNAGQQTTEAPTTKTAPTTAGQPTENTGLNAGAATASDSAPIAVAEKTEVVAAVPVPVQPALALPWPPPGDFVLVTGSGPVGRLAMIWGNKEFPVSQEFGHTDFSLSQPTMYRYGIAYGLDGRQHTGLDIGMPAGTWLYSPVEGVVKTSGGTPYFTFYGNGQPRVGELLIVTDAGDEVVLGHMGAISVGVGERVSVGEFVGLSGGENGDHLHLEVRELQPRGGFRIVDPRDSFLMGFLESAATLDDDLLPDEGLLGGSVVNPDNDALTGASEFASDIPSAGLPADGLLESGQLGDSIVDPGDGLGTKPAPDPFLPEDPLLGDGPLEEFIVDPRNRSLTEPVPSDASLPNDRLVDGGLLDHAVLRESVVDPGSALLAEPPSPVPPFPVDSQLKEF